MAKDKKAEATIEPQTEVHCVGLIKVRSGRYQVCRIRLVGDKVVQAEKCYEPMAAMYARSMLEEYASDLVYEAEES